MVFQGAAWLPAEIINRQLVYTQCRAEGMTRAYPVEHREHSIRIQKQTELPCPMI